MRPLDRLPALRNRDYRLLFGGQLWSFMGDEMAPVAITFAILDRGGGARQVGVVLGAGTIAMVLLLLFGGVVADRLSRRVVMLGADVLRCVTQALVAILLISGHWQVWELAVLAALAGAGAAFFNPALTGLLPELLTGDDLRQANALQGLAFGFGEVAGPALGGILVVTVGAGSALAIDAGTFALSALSLFRLRAPAVARRGARSGVLSDLREGWQGFRSRSWLWSIVAEFSLWHMFVYAPTIVLGAVVAKARLGGATAWGTILALLGIGSVIGGLVALRWRPRHPLRMATILSVGFAAIPALLAAGAPLALLGGAAALGGAGLAIFGTLWDTTVQQQVPAELLSRVSSYDWFGSTALLPAGYALAGPLAVVLGLNTTLWLAAGLGVLGVLALLTVPSVRQLTAGQPPPERLRADPGAAA